MGDLFGLALQRVQVVEDRQAFGKDGLASQGQAVLREIAEGRPFHPRKLPVVDGFEAGEDLQDGGLAGAVAADQAGALVRRDQPVDVFKEEFLAKALAGGRELEHRFLFSHCRKKSMFALQKEILLRGARFLCSLAAGDSEAATAPRCRVTSESASDSSSD